MKKIISILLIILFIFSCGVEDRKKKAEAEKKQDKTKTGKRSQKQPGGDNLFRLDITVSDIDGLPVKNAVVKLYKQPVNFEKKTSASGKAVFKINTADKYELRVKADGYIRWGQHSLKINEDNPEHNIECTLEKGESIKGRIITPENNGIQSASVKSYLTDKYDNSHQYHACWAGNEEVVSDTRGYFEINGLPEGR